MAGSLMEAPLTASQGGGWQGKLMSLGLGLGGGIGGGFFNKKVLGHDGGGGGGGGGASVAAAASAPVSSQAASATPAFSFQSEIPQVSSATDQVEDRLSGLGL